MILTAKVVAIGLGVAMTAFTISTIVLAVNKTNLENELKEANEKVKMLEDALQHTSTAAPTTTTTTTTTTAGSGSTETTSQTSSATTISTSTTADPPAPINYRLPDNIYPILYDLYLHPNIATGNFTGQLTISVNTTNPLDTIKLHALNMEISSVYLVNKPSDTIFVKQYYLEAQTEFLVIELSEEIQAHVSFGIGFIFSGTMLNKIVGLYSSTYVKADNTVKRISSSKFEPTYARQAYPCFDEPAMKAQFLITLVYPNDGGYHALSNMNIDKEQNNGEFTEAYFKTSVPMSTYLSCFIISDFLQKSVQIDTKGIGEDFDMRVFATPEQLNKVDFAVDVGKGVIEYYIDYFQIGYPLPKLDMIAIPDFVSGAMEHWGLVTYRETSLLYDVTVSSTSNKQRIASVIAHEFAHMWFGNLVTMNWWSDLWLNEGFASYIENKGVESVYPDWGMRDQFIIGTLHGVLNLDATLGAHPIIQTVENPDQITEIFDTITYSKGASLVRMLESFLGEENFRHGVTNYLNKYAYRTAVTDDFLTEVENIAGGLPVKAIMRTWTEQMGLPVVEVERISTTQLRLKQKRFFSNPEDYEGTYNDSPFNYTWSIPITFQTNTDLGKVSDDWFYYDKTELLITVPPTTTWVKFNYNQMGYYRVNYPATMWDSLATQLINEPFVFTIGDRASLLNDAFALADSTQLSYDVALDMTKYLAKETDYVPWSVASSKLTSLKRALMFTDIYVDYKDYSRGLIKPIYSSVGWVPGDKHLENRLRVTINSAACSLGLNECLTEAGTEFTKFLSNPTVRPVPDIRDTVYYYGMMEIGDEKTWEQMWQLFIAEKDASEKSKLMSGLAAVQVPYILSHFIDLAWNEDYVRSQDYFSCLQSIAGNPVGESIVWDFVRENWPRLVERFGLNERYLGNMIPSITARFATQTKLEEMEYFFNKYPEAGAGAAARVRALETVKNNIVWLENNREKIGAWLIKQKE